MAMPGILQQIAKSNPMLQSIKQMIGMVNASRNPQDMISYLAKNNPDMQKVMEIINASGGDPMKAFEEAARQRGLDPQEILNMLKE